jgi:hypothetical protein
MLQEPLANPFFQQDLVWVMETRRGKGEEKSMKVTITYIRWERFKNFLYEDGNHPYVPCAFIQKDKDVVN